MQYLTARWLVVKTLPANKINNLHKLERAVFNYALACKAQFPKSKTTPPLWWQCTGSFLSPEIKKIWGRSYQEFLDADSELRSVCARENIDLINVFSDIRLMHRLDALAPRV